jgi:hypothetical protein
MSENVKPGWVRVGTEARFRPFLAFRQIIKGKHRGMVEITLPAQPARKVLVDPSSIRSYPVQVQKQEALPLSEGPEVCANESPNP